MFVYLYRHQVDFSGGLQLIRKARAMLGSTVHQLGSLQVLRAVAVLLIVARHLQVYAARASGSSPMLGQFFAGDMGVDLFFVISGFIMVTVHRSPVARPAQAAEFLYRRVSRVYPLYWFYSLLALVVYLWWPGWLHRFDVGMDVHPLRSFLLWPQRHWPLLGQAWSLVYEMYFYLVYAGLLLLPARWFWRGLLFWAGAVLTGNFILAYLPALDCPETRLVCALLTLEFIAGALVGLAVRRTEPTRRHAVWGWLAVGLSVAWIVGGLLPLEVHLAGGRRLLGYGVPAVALVYGFTVLENAGRRPAPFLARIGDWSYSVYLSHIFVIAAVAHLTSWLPALGWVTQSLLEISSVAAVLLTGALSYRYLEIPLLQMSRRPLSLWTNPPLAVPSADPSRP